MQRREFLTGLVGAQLPKSPLIRPVISTAPSPVAGTITIIKPAGAVSWDITVKLARNTVFISTPNREWGLAFAQELLIAASAAPTNNQPEKEKSANAKPVV